MLGNYLQQTTSADIVSRCIFLGAFRVKVDNRGFIKERHSYLTLIRLDNVTIFYLTCVVITVIVKIMLSLRELNAQINN